jgi:hypothetical protein
VENYERGYVTGSVLLGSAAFAVAAPEVAAVIGAYETGVSTTETISGESSGIHVSNLFTGFDAGRELSTGERVERGVVAGLGWATRGVAAFSGRGGETYYRTMSRADADELLLTGRVPATRETFISPNRAFSENYEGVLVEFRLRPGTTQQLEVVGVRDASALTGSTYPGMPRVSRGWTGSSAFFKAEGGQINIGLGRGTALDIFNENIRRFSVVRR